VIIFYPSVDIDLARPSPYKREIIGEIKSIISGEINGKIYMNAGSFIRSLYANKPVKMSLIKHPEEDYYYPISIADWDS